MSDDTMIPDENDSPLFGLFAKIGLSIDSLATQVKRSNDREQRRLEAIPRVQTFENVVGNTAATTAFYDFGVPQPGRQWQVRLIGAQGPAGATGASTWYIGPNLNGTAVNTSARWQFPNVPNFENFSGSQLTVLPMQHLMVAFTGLAPNVPIGIVAVVNDIPLWAQGGIAAIE